MEIALGKVALLAWGAGIVYVGWKLFAGLGLPALDALTSGAGGLDSIINLLYGIFAFAGTVVAFVLFLFVGIINE